MIKFKSMQSAQEWTLANIYGPCQGDSWVTYTNWLLNLNIPPNEDWLLLGDFNYILARIIEINLVGTPMT